MYEWQIAGEKMPNVIYYSIILRSEPDTIDKQDKKLLCSHWDSQKSCISDLAVVLT